MFEKLYDPCCRMKMLFAISQMVTTCMGVSPKSFMWAS